MTAVARQKWRFSDSAGHDYIFKNANIEMGREIFENKGLHDIDIMATFNDKVVFAECKGRISPTPIEDINKWLKVKVPTFRAWFGKQEGNKSKAVEFEYWSSTGYTEDALKRIAEVQTDYKRNIVRFLGPLEIMERAREMKNKKLQKELNTFFFKSNV